MRLPLDSGYAGEIKQNLGPRLGLLPIYIYMYIYCMPIYIYRYMPISINMNRFYTVSQYTS